MVSALHRVRLAGSGVCEGPSCLLVAAESIKSNSRVNSPVLIKAGRRVAEEEEEEEECETLFVSVLMCVRYLF